MKKLLLALTFLGSLSSFADIRIDSLDDRLRYIACDNYMTQDGGILESCYYSGEPVGVIKACGRAMLTDANKLGCLFRSPSIDMVNYCDKAYNTDYDVLRCIRIKLKEIAEE